jgi:hypothetical protein
MCINVVSIIVMAGVVHFEYVHTYFKSKESSRITNWNDNLVIDIFRHWWQINSSSITVTPSIMKDDDVKNDAFPFPRYPEHMPLILIVGKWLSTGKGFK